MSHIIQSNFQLHHKAQPCSVLSPDSGVWGLIAVQLPGESVEFDAQHKTYFWSGFFHHFNELKKFIAWLAFQNVKRAYKKDNFLAGPVIIG